MLLGVPEASKGPPSPPLLGGARRTPGRLRVPPGLRERGYEVLGRSIERASEKSFWVSPPSEWVHTDSVTSL